MLISETVSARAKRTQFLDQPRKKTYLTGKIHFWSCDLEKVKIQMFFAEKLLISETISARAKRKQFGDHSWKKTVFDGKIFGLAKTLISEAVSGSAKPYLYGV